jgi:signal transduction histidine kinase
VTADRAGAYETAPFTGAETTGSRSALLPGTLVAASVGAAVVVGLAVLLSVTDPPATPYGYVRPLLAAGFLCLAFLAVRRVAALAWVSLVAAGLFGSSVPIALSRAVDPGELELATWLVVAARSSGAAIITVAIAALYATRPERQATRRITTLAMVLVAWLIAACVLAIILIVGGTTADPAFTWIDVAVGPTALVVHIVLVLTAFGVAGDVRAAVARADARGVRRSGAGAVPSGKWLRAVARELIPGGAEAEATAIEAERARLAGDLHAVVLPSLRRAIADIEHGGSADSLAERLRLIDLELERLMADRWPVVLDAFGLVAAVEELAERVEVDDRLRVAVEIGADDGRPPRLVERAAWRIVQLAVDNAVRHASAVLITISLELGPARAVVAIADDGIGLDPAAAIDLARSGARGMADLTRRAAAVGGELEVGSNGARGTRVRFRWPARPD